MLATMLPALMILVGMVLLVLPVWASFYVCSGIYLKAHCRGKTGEKQIALTFDDGPHKDHTSTVLDILKTHHIKAAFFLIGENIIHHENMVRRIVEEGHIIGNHSYTHASTFGFFSKKKVLADLQKNALLIKDVTGKEVNLFRPPFGVTNPHIGRAARFLDYTVVGWSIRSLDTMGKSPGKIIKRVIKRLKPGAVILFHDNHGDIAQILEEVIAKAAEEGYEFVSPEVLLNINAYK